ncbi:phage tail tip lysozyme [Methylobacterium sp. J-030]|uniref:phage tail tip lysozyme n=1 Tax=Methylobacterium sp. J-030 TaxID=2836627 RepID=UPI001FB873D5|nr:phage tail tip lysozyme [Methylobacterium sp. J-030]MCJ2067644.1 phage tail tip lysozyme [Methylobacterium sp. J-030]
MADNWIESFAVALGFDVNTASLNTAKKSIADYETAVTAAEKRIEDARWAGAKTEEEVAKLTRETNLKEARAALAAAQDKEKAEKEQARKREERHKEFIAGLSRVALAATAMATAVGFAVNKVTGAFDNLGFVSARTGASVQSLKALGYAFSQVGGTSEQAISAVESFQKALRENSGVKSYVQSLGVDMTKDPAEQMLDTVRKLQKHPYDVGFREAGQAGISEENYKLITQYIDQLDRYQAEYNSLTKSLGVNSEQAAAASQSFQRSLTRLQATSAALSDRLMTSLAPALEAIVARFNKFIADNPEVVNTILRTTADGIIWITDKIQAMVEWFASDHGKMFIDRWNDFADRVAAIGHAFETVWAVLKKIDEWLHLSSIYSFIDKLGTLILSGRFGLGGAIQDALGVGQGGGKGVGFDEQRERAPEDRPGIFRRAARAVKRTFSGGSADAHGGDGGLAPEDDGTITTHGHRWKPGANSAGGKERVASWLKFFQGPIAEGGMGADLGTARAMVAMMQGESTANLDPTIKGDPDPSGRPTSFGTAQWHADRFTQLKAFAARMGVDWTDVGAQQQFLRHEFLRGRYQGVWNRIKAASTEEAKLREGIDGYENPKFKQKAYDFRLPNLHALRRSGAGVAPAEAANSKIVVPPAAGVRGLPSMSPGGFDPNHIDPKNLMQPAPVGASPVTNTSTSSSSRSLTQHNSFKVDITGSQTPREHADAFTKSADGLYALALRNVQTATV